MSRNIIANAFSLNMLSGEIPVSTKTSNRPGLTISIKEVTPDQIPKELYSIVGHADTAKIISSIIGTEILPNRENYKVERGDLIYVAQYNGPRLPEGATKLPEGASIKFYLVEYVDLDPGSGYLFTWPF